MAAKSNISIDRLVVVAKNFEDIVTDFPYQGARDFEGGDKIHVTGNQKYAIDAAAFSI